MNILNKITVFITVILSVFLYGYFYDFPVIGIDDANIYMVYMRNAANGDGFVYNIGGERVEGFTSLLWCLIGALCYKVNPNYIEYSLLCINTLLVSHAIMQLSVFFAKINNHKFISPIAILFLGLLVVIPGFYEWTVLSLLETGLWTWVIINLVINLSDNFLNKSSKKNDLFLNILFIIALLTRPESLLVIPFCIMIRFLQLKQHENYLITVKNIIPFIVVFLLSSTLLIVWRIHYFGFPFPNTYYAKVSNNLLANMTDGLHYLNLFFGFTSPFGMIVFILICLYSLYFIFNKPKELAASTQIQLFLSGFCLLFFLIPLYTGGDHFGLSRIYQPIIPILYIFFLNQKAWEVFFPKIMPVINKYLFNRYIGVIFMLIILYFSPNKKLHQLNKESAPLYYEFWFAQKGREQGNELNQFWNKNEYPSVGVITAGGIAYTYSGKIVDLMGLNLVKMAHAVKEKSGPKNHAAFDKATFYEITPDIFWYHSNLLSSKDTLNFILDENKENHTQDFMFRACKGIVYDSIFKEKYKPVFIAKKNTQFVIQSYVSISYLQQLDTNQFVIIPIKRNL